MAAEKAHDDQPEPLTLLGQVTPPAPEVLDRAREVLWSAVTAEMLASPPPGTAHTAGTAHESAGTSRECGQES